MTTLSRRPSRAVLHLLAAATLSVCMTSVALATAPSSDSQRYAEEAASYVQKGDLQAAIIQLKNAVSADPNNLSARYQLALIYLRTGDAASAERELETAHTRGFDDTKVLQPLAEALFAQGKYAQVTKLDAGKVQGPARASLYAIQARAKLALRDPDGAKAAIAKALAEDPNSADALVANATFLRQDGKLAEAEAEVDKALAKSPDVPEVAIMKGELRGQQGDVKGALALFDGLIKKNPRYTRAYAVRAMARLNANDLAGAGADISFIRTNEPNNLIGSYLEAYLLARQDKASEASAILLAHQALIDTYPPAEYLMAVTSLSDGKLEAARGYAEHYVARAPQDVSGAQLLATVNLRLNNPRKAVEILEPWATRMPDNQPLKMALANAYLSAGRATEAVTLFRQGLASDPGNTDVQYALAVSQLRAGSRNDAETGLAKLLSANPNFLQANFMLVMSQLQSRQYDKALATAEGMIKAKPADPNGYNVRGTVQLAMGNTDAAAASFKAALDKDPKFASAALNLARLDEKAGDLAAAKSWYDKALTVDPKNVEAFDGLAQIAVNQGDEDAAIKYLEQAIAADGQAAEPRLRLVTLYLGRKDTERALIAARDFANTLPGNVDATEALGRAQMAGGDYTNAVGSYRQIVTRLKDNAEAQRRLGNALVAAAMTGKADKAINFRDARIAYDHAIEIAPDSLPTLTDRIALERVSVNPDAALTLAHKFAADRPESAARLIALGDAEMAARKTDDAIADYRKAAAKDTSGVATQHLFTALDRTGKDAEGVTVLQAWVAKTPGDHDSRLMLASYYIAKAKYDDAIRESETLNTTSPNNPAVLNNLAWLYGQKKDPKAFTFAAKAFQIAPHSADVADTYGWLQVTNGDAAKGADLMRRAHEMAPERADISYRYAVALEKRGEQAKAKAVLQKSLATPAAFTERPQAEQLLKQLGG